MGRLKLQWSLSALSIEFFYLRCSYELRLTQKHLYSSNLEFPLNILTLSKKSSYTGYVVYGKKKKSSSSQVFFTVLKQKPIRGTLEGKSMLFCPILWINKVHQSLVQTASQFFASAKYIQRWEISLTLEIFSSKHIWLLTSNCTYCENL